jgi:hypothetical protein
VGDRYLTDLADVVRAAGLEVVEVDGWETRARGSGGYDGNRPWCVVWHHTASSTTPENDVNYIVHGCPDAPVANLYLARDGTVHVCAAGACNHAGKGGPATFTRGTVPVDQMNTHAIGVEAANAGTGERWPAEQVDAYFALSLALSGAYGFAIGDVITHNEWAPDRKIDPATAAAVEGEWQPGAVTSAGTWSLADIRSELAHRAPPPPPEETDMYIAHLADGTICVVGSAVRPLSGEELQSGALGGLPHYTPAPDSNWHYWLSAGVAEYSRRVTGG